MKTKRRFKKSLAVLLAAVLALSSMWGITAFGAASDNEISQLSSAITTYKAELEGYAQKMADGTAYAYTGLEDAYEAYIAAVATYDAYHYGGNTNVDATAAYNELYAAMQGIKEWKPAEFNAVAYHYSDVATNGYNNLLWTSGPGTTKTGVTMDRDNIETQMYSPQTVVYAYDGIEGHEPYSPLVMQTWWDSRHDNKYGFIFSVFPGDGEDVSNLDTNGGDETGTWHTEDFASTFALTDYWQGYWDADTEKWGGTGTYSYRIGYSRETELRPEGYTTYDQIHSIRDQITDMTGVANGDNRNTMRYYWNKLQYVGDGSDMTASNYYWTYMGTITYAVDHFAEWDTTWWSTKGSNGTNYDMTDVTNRYVMNYKPVLDNVQGYAQAIGRAIVDNGIDSYLEGGLTTAIQNMDRFTENQQLDPTNSTYYDWGSTISTSTIESNLTSYGTVLGNTVTLYGYSESTANIQKDGTGYSSIITELTSYGRLKELYECNNEYTSEEYDYTTNIFTETSYAAFHTAMENVINFMSTLDSDEFTKDETAQAYATALATAAAALEYDYDHHHTDSVWHDEEGTERTATLTVEYPATDATCEEKGTVDIYVCNVCKMYFVLTNEENDTYTQLDQYNYNNLVYTDALGHDYSDEADSTDPDGYKYIDFTWQGLDGDDVNAVTCTATFTCKECGKTTTENCTVTPTGTAATCTEDASYSLSATATITNPRDSETVTGTATESFTSDALGHSWFNPQFTWSPDYSSCTFSVECLNDESHNVNQQDCGEIDVKTLDPTCTTDGMTVYTATYTVEDGTTFTDTEEVIHDEEKATGHSWDASTLDFMWDSGNNCLIMVQCDTCKEYAGTVLALDEEQPFGTSGYVTTETVDATCEEDGKTTYMAKGQIIDPFTGNPIELDGETEFSSSYEVTIPSNDGRHDFGTDPEIAGKSATCTENGQKDIYKCSVCKNLYVENEDGTYTQVEGVDDEAAIIPATGHTLAEDPVYTKAATCTEPGYEYYACKNCSCGDDCACNKFEVTDADNDATYNYCEAVEIPATGHDSHLTHVTAKDATCTEEGNVEYWQCASCEATFTDPYAEEPLDSNDITISATGHAWPETPSGATFTWNEDYSECTATITCENGCKTTLEEKLNVVDEKDVNGIIVTTDDDGTTYTATATFTDTDAEEAQQAVGPYTDTQFVAAEGHVHQMVHVPAVAATCTSEGNISYYYCETCYKMFSDYAGEHELTEDDVIINMAPHTIGEEIPLVPATCTEAGALRVLRLRWAVQRCRGQNSHHGRGTCNSCQRPYLGCFYFRFPVG